MSKNADINATPMEAKVYANIDEGSGQRRNRLTPMSGGPPKKMRRLFGASAAAAAAAAEAGGSGGNNPVDEKASTGPSFSPVDGGDELSKMLHQIHPSLARYAESLREMGYIQPSDFEYMQDLALSFVQTYGIPPIQFKRIINGLKQIAVSTPQRCTDTKQDAGSTLKKSTNTLHQKELAKRDAPLNEIAVLDVVGWGNRPVIRKYLPTVKEPLPPLQLGCGLGLANFQTENIKWMRHVEDCIRREEAKVMLKDPSVLGKALVQNDIPQDLHEDLFRCNELLVEWGGFVLADSVGMGKTLELLALIMMDRKKMMEMGEYRKYRILGVDVKTGLKKEMQFKDEVTLGYGVRVEVTATLVLCPPHLCKQWELQAEMWKATNLRNWKVLTVLTPSDLNNITIRKIAKEVDVVILNTNLVTGANLVAGTRVAETDLQKLFYESRNTPRAERYRQRTGISEENSLHDSAQDLLKMRPHLINQITWRRVILDEGHEMFDNSCINARIFRTLVCNNIFARTRIYASGTPMPTEDCFRGIMGFLNLRINKIPAIYLDYIYPHSYSNSIGKFTWMEPKVSHVMKMKHLLCPILHDHMYRRQTMATLTEEDKQWFPKISWKMHVEHYLSPFEKLLYDKVEETLQQLAEDDRFAWQHLLHRVCRHPILLIYDDLKPKKIKKLAFANSQDILSELITFLHDKKDILESDVERFDNNIRDQTQKQNMYPRTDPKYKEIKTEIDHLKQHKRKCEVNIRIHSILVEKLMADDVLRVADECYESSKLKELHSTLDRLLYDEEGNENTNKIIVNTHSVEFARIIREMLQRKFKDKHVELKGTSAMKNKSALKFKKETKTRIAFISGLATASGSDFGMATHIILASAMEQREIKSHLIQVIGRGRRMTLNDNMSELQVFQLIAKDSVEVGQGKKNRATVIEI